VCHNTSLNDICNILEGGCILLEAIVAERDIVGKIGPVARQLESFGKLGLGFFIASLGVKQATLSHQAEKGKGVHTTVSTLAIISPKGNLGQEPHHRRNLSTVQRKTATGQGLPTLVHREVWITRGQLLNKSSSPIDIFFAIEQ
jgi:hypothetical protein